VLAPGPKAILDLDLASDAVRDVGVLTWRGSRCGRRRRRRRSRSARAPGWTTSNCSDGISISRLDQRGDVGGRADEVVGVRNVIRLAAAERARTDPLDGGELIRVAS
jgi:hypothetical protein